MLLEPAASVVGRIYEAALMPLGWPSVIEALCTVSGSASGVIVIGNLRDGVQGIGTKGVNDLFQQTIRDPRWADNPRVRHVWGDTSAKPAHFFATTDGMSAAEIARDGVKHALEQMGLGYQSGTVATLPDGNNAAFTFERRSEKGRHSQADLAQLDAFRPHLMRAALMAGQLSLQRAESMAQALDAVGFPAAVITRRGRAIALNASFQQCRVLLLGAFEKIAVTSRHANALLQNALNRYINPLAGSSIAVPTSKWDETPSVIHLLPICGTANDILAGAAFLLIVTSVNGTSAAAGQDALLLQNLFGLTPKEAALAAALASGLSLKEAAAQQRMQLSTARTHLARVFLKTETHQQSQLVLLLKNAQPFPREGASS